MRIALRRASPSHRVSLAEGGPTSARRRRSRTQRLACCAARAEAGGVRIRAAWWRRRSAHRAAQRRVVRRETQPYGTGGSHPREGHLSEPGARARAVCAQNRAVAAAAAHAQLACGAARRGRRRRRRICVAAVIFGGVCGEDARAAAEKDARERHGRYALRRAQLVRAPLRRRVRARCQLERACVCFVRKNAHQRSDANVAREVCRCALDAAAWWPVRAERAAAVDAWRVRRRERRARVHTHTRGTVGAGGAR